MPTVSISIQKDTIISAAKLASAAQQKQLSIEQVLTRSLRQQLQPTPPNKKILHANAHSRSAKNNNNNK